jgi:peptidoglycan-N-acetylglucosamine deacetylase
MAHTPAKVFLLLMILTLLPAAARASGYTSMPAVFTIRVDTQEHILGDNDSFVSRETLITSNAAVNADLLAIIDDYERELSRKLIPDSAKNPRRNSRLDIHVIYSRTGESWLSVMVQARVSYMRAQVCDLFTLRTYDLATGEQILMTDLFPADSGAWSLLASEANSQLSACFPDRVADPDVLASMCRRDSLERTAFRLGASQLTLLYTAGELFSGKPGILSVQIPYNRLAGMLTPAAERQTDNSAWKMVALTYDDGPSYEKTIAVLNVLRKYGASGTFFFVANRVEEFLDIAQRLCDEGHAIETHGNAHRSPFTMTNDRLLEDLKTSSETIANFLGKAPRLLRPAYGSYPPYIAAKAGLPLIMWSVDPNDWDGRTPMDTFAVVRSRVQDGDIILLHDIKENTSEATALIADYLCQRGYMLVSVEDLMLRDNVTMQADKLYFRCQDGVTSDRTDKP